MRQILQLMGLLGMVWTLVVLGLGFGLPDTPPGLLFLSLVSAQFFVFWRLFGLRRWAAVSACLYCGYMVLDSFGSGIWQWAVMWLLITGLMTTLVTKAWKELRRGL